MEFLQLVKERYSVRKFSQEPVAAEAVMKILEAGRHAPTAHNNQPQRILALQSEEALEKIRRCTQCHYQAPLAFVICADLEESWKREFDGVDSAWVDASIVTDHMMLEAASLGVGSTWVMFFQADAVREEFELEDQLLPVAILVMGYPASDSLPSIRHESRKALTETVRFL